VSLVSTSVVDLHNDINSINNNNISYLFYTMQPALDKYTVVTTGLNENGRT